jgi:hypothetical protein
MLATRLGTILPRTTFTLLGLALAAALPAAAQDAPPNRVEHVFDLAAVRGDRAPIAFEIAHPGTVTARAEWDGASRLLLALKPRGGERAVAREFGSSPLSLRHELSAETLRALGKHWVIELTSLGEAAGGELAISWPGPRLLRPFEEAPAERWRADRVRVDAGRARIADRVWATEQVTGPTTTPPQLPPGGGGGEARRSVLPNGDVRIDYADGSALILDANCGSTRIFPDGTQTKTLCHQVQGAGLPAPPGGDPAFGGFLDGHAESLLSQIRHLVGNDTQAMANYKAVEADGATTVVERIDLRRRYVDRLLGVGF